ncbi:hypothetical protein BC939DRAFT_442676 [Gamsiella multidivaricata]|uniref:uncharacterized protein n=1 Tax=Gamsiella multidivaricata TaxID=101098 RepID=UPI00221FB5BE|nr:uncharacterized protein BC939DRAFT_442676 [Gamsiella multidivaricata]KAI7828707.1 hypothetical protein BC939DRAFT_442676 [Gamsiella multidivaricata]
MELRRFLRTILPRLPRLTCLRIEDSFSWQKIHIREILYACQSLLSLDCDSSVALQFDDAFHQQGTISKDETAAAGHGDNNNNNSNASNDECEDSNKHGNVHQAQGTGSVLPAPTPTSGSLSTSESTQQRLDLPAQHLRILRLHKTSLTDQELLRLVQECPQLQELYLHQDPGTAPTGGQHSVSAVSSISGYTSAASSSLLAHHHSWNWSTEFVTDLAKSCPNLVRIHLSPGCFQSLPEEVLLKVLDAFPRLRGLGVPFSKFGDQTMLEILRTRTGTRTRPTQALPPLMLPSSTGSGYLPLQEPPRPVDGSLYYSALTSLDLTHIKGNRLSNAMLQTSFERSPELLRFCGNEQMIDVEDMVLQDTGALRPWACTHLETLIIGFRFQNSDDPCNSSMKDIKDDDIVYQQLSRLTKMRKLTILKDGPTCKSRSSLGLLASLQVLQSFMIPRWDNNTGLQTEQLDAVRWMAKSWNCLQQLHLPWAGNTPRTKQIRQLLHDLSRSSIEVVPSDD